MADTKDAPLTEMVVFYRCDGSDDEDNKCQVTNVSFPECQMVLNDKHAGEKCG